LGIRNHLSVRPSVDSGVQITGGTKSQHHGQVAAIWWIWADVDVGNVFEGSTHNKIVTPFGRSQGDMQRITRGSEAGTGQLQRPNCPFAKRSAQANRGQATEFPANSFRIASDAALGHHRPHFAIVRRDETNRDIVNARSGPTTLSA